jgi:DNA-binding NtrC family response regulator
VETLFGPEALQRWERHPWPGNIRELRNAVEAALVVGPRPYDEEPMPVVAYAGDTPLGNYKDARAAVLKEFEKSYLERLLAEANGNVSQAARTAKMDRSHLIDLLQRHGLKS